MEENQKKSEMEFPDEGQTNTKKELTSRDILRIVGLILGLYWIGKGIFGMLTSGN